MDDLHAGSETKANMFFSHSVRHAVMTLLISLGDEMEGFATATANTNWG